GTTAPATVTLDGSNPSQTRFTGTLTVEEAGEYVVAATGTDRAGNRGSDEASAVVYTQFTLADGVMEIPASGTTIQFHLADDVDDAVAAQELYAALSENGVNPHLGPEHVGVGFLTADLDAFLDYYLAEGTVESATISMVVDEEALGGLDPEDAQIHYYDESTGQWDPVDTEYEVVDDVAFLTAQVTHFSTYGAIVVDEEPPTVLEASPTGESKFEADADEVLVSFSYVDELSGVDVGSVSIAVNGVDVTASERTNITADTAEHSLAVEAGTDYNVSLTVVDHAGNRMTDSTSFAVAGTDDPGDDDPADDDPSDDDPADDDPGDDDPADDDPADDDPGDDDPADDDPADDDPGDDDPGDDDPADDDPADDEPVGDGSSDDPVGDDSSDDDPGEGSPSDEEPTETQPGSETPSDEELTEGAPNDDSTAESGLDTDPAENPTTYESVPGFGFLVALGALMVVSGLLARRYRTGPR
ncbi:MAG: hypothetical protein ACQETI_12695, partial [Halobacteriota archaeon]